MSSLGKGVLAAALVVAGAANAGPPEGADPRLKPWFESLQQPGTGASCCTMSDCRVAQSRRNGDGYEVYIDDRWNLSRPFWVRVPPNRVLDRGDNPTGRAVVCYTPESGVLCFVRPPDS